MSSKTPDITKHQRPKKAGTPIMVRLQGEQLAALDQWISKQEEELSRPEAVRRLMIRALLEHRG